MPRGATGNNGRDGGQLRRNCGCLTREPEHDPEKWRPVFGTDHAQTVDYCLAVALRLSGAPAFCGFFFSATSVFFSPFFFVAVFVLCCAGGSSAAKISLQA